MCNEKEDYFETILDTMKAQFGNSVKNYWVYDGDLCPCCLTRSIGVMMHNGKEALSINAFMYRERGVLIAYMLCGQCAQGVIAEAKHGPTVLHDSIEKNLTNAYLRYMNSLD